MSDPAAGDALERYRASYLKLRSVLHDRTTALPAYPLLLDALRTMLDRRRRVGVLHLSLAHLGRVESLYGWQVFDRVLSRVAGALRSMAADRLPPGTLLGVDRVAGDEFLLFVPQAADGTEVDGEFLAEVGSRVCAGLQAVLDGDDFAGLNPRLRFRAGQSLLSLDPFYRFERRVYAAVEEARTQERRRTTRRERSRDEELKRIIQDADVSAVFQPVVELATGDVLGYEAFARGPKDSAFEMPHAMFSASSAAGVASDLDRLCRKAALRESAAVDGRGELFVNVLPGGLEDPEWSEGANAGPDGAWRDRWNLVLEVSERGGDGDCERFVASLERLKGLGFTVALDDIGTGYASLGTLERVRPHYLKVDPTVVRGVNDNLIKQEVLGSLVQIAERIGASLVAEGIETEDEAATLRQVGARFGQGYLFAAPSPASGVNVAGRRRGEG